MADIPTLNAKLDNAIDSVEALISHPDPGVRSAASATVRTIREAADLLAPQPDPGGVTELATALKTFAESDMNLPQ